MAAHQAPPSLGFSRQEQWSGLAFPSPMQESEKWKWSCSVMSDSLRPHGLQPARLLHPWDFPGKSTGVGCHIAFSGQPLPSSKKQYRLVAKKQTSGPEDLNLIPSITVRTFVFLITIGITIVNHYRNITYKLKLYIMVHFWEPCLQGNDQ